VTFDGSPASAESIMKMNRVLQPRGPDAAGITAYQRAAFGHQRLKIIDLSHRGGQPMVDPELGLSLVFNGCIYNYRELRTELEEKGYRFFSTSDTEVILKAWAEWGLDAPKRMNGMFGTGLGSSRCIIHWAMGENACVLPLRSRRCWLQAMWIPVSIP